MAEQDKTPFQELKEKDYSIIELCYAIREKLKDEKCHLTSITDRQCLEDTYTQMLNIYGLCDETKFLMIHYAMVRENYIDDLIKYGTRKR